MPFNPLVDSFDSLTDIEVEEKVINLSRKYWQTHNPDLRMQIASILDMYQEELKARRAKSYQEQQQNGNSDLDNLINVS